jgi:MYXO-CTERM domain-containing protein
VTKGLDDVASWDQAAALAAPVPANIASTAGAPQGGPLLPDTSSMPQKKACGCDFRSSGDETTWTLGSLALVGLLLSRRRDRGGSTMSRSGVTR